MNKNKNILFLLITALIVLTTGCNLPSSSNKDGNNTIAPTAAQAMEDLVNTAEANLPKTVQTEEGSEETGELIINRNEKQEQEVPAQPTVPPEPTADPNRKPPELPAIFKSDLLNPLDTPHQYEEDICKVIKNRWGTGKAAPGTVVMAIMYHGIAKGDTVNQDNAITSDRHKQLMRNLHDQGFTAINTEQFIAFMENNDWIPERSVLLIVDDRHFEQNYIDHFKDYYDEWGWPVINAWISAKDTTQQLWDENAHVEEIGLVDHQAHGVVHQTPMGKDSTDEYLIGELKGSVDAIQEHFHKTPRAIIWPGGGFAERPIEIAKEYGYKVGFTTLPRGPVMYNWVPLCDVSDAARPYYMIDGNQDPMFVIPRYWSPDASEHVDTVRQIGKSAKEYYESIRGIELEYYDIVCKPEMGDL